MSEPRKICIRLQVFLTLQNDTRSSISSVVQGVGYISKG